MSDQKEYAAAWAEQTGDFGKRPDGSPKGRGFFGVLKRPDGDISTEISVGVNIDGKDVEIPTLVPGLSRAQVKRLLDGEAPDDDIVDRAVAHARDRMKAGKSPFAEPDDEIQALPEPE